MADGTQPTAFSTSLNITPFLIFSVNNSGTTQEFFHHYFYLSTNLGLILTELKQWNWFKKSKLRPKIWECKRLSMYKERKSRAMLSLIANEKNLFSKR